MTRGGLICLLLAGCVSVCHLQTDGFRSRFRPVDPPKTWTEAQSYCREKFADLATIQDETDGREVKALVNRGKFWIGLKRSWRWSHSGQELSTDPLLLNWAPNEPSSGACVTVDQQGWHTPVCGSLHQVLCYSAESQKHILVQELMTRNEAKSHCRLFYTDLSSILSQRDTEEIVRLLQNNSEPTGGSTGANGTEGGTTTVSTDSLPDAWMGLRRMPLEWSDQSSAPYRRWAAGQPVRPAECVLIEASTGEWSSAACSEQHSFMCSSAVTHSVVTSVKFRLSAGAVDLNDPEIQLAVLQQLKQKLEEGGVGGQVKLRWRTQPDGKVFHREEEQSAPPAGPDDTAGCDSEVHLN